MQLYPSLIKPHTLKLFWDSNQTGTIKYNIINIVLVGALQKGPVIFVRHARSPIYMELPSPRMLQ